MLPTIFLLEVSTLTFDCVLKAETKASSLCYCFCSGHDRFENNHNYYCNNSSRGLVVRTVAIIVKTREAFRDLRVEPSGKVTAANSYLKHNPKHYNQNKPPCANKTLFRSSCTKQAVKLWLQSCAAGTGLHFFSRVSLEPHRPATAPSLQLLKHSLLRHFKVAQKLPKQTVLNRSQS